MDMSLGGNWNGDRNEALASIRRYNSVAPYNRLMSRNLDNFTQLLAGKWEEYGETLFSCDDIARRLDHYAEMFVSSGAWKREYNKWNGNPVPLCEDIADELAYVKDWYGQNHESLNEQIEPIVTVGINGITEERGVLDRNGQHSFARRDWHALDGRRMGAEAMRKGIYIVGGRKQMLH